MNLQTFDASGQNFSWQWDRDKNQWSKIEIKSDNIDLITEFILEVFRDQNQAINNFAVTKDQNLIVIAGNDKILISQKKNGKYQKPIPIRSPQQDEETKKIEIKTNCTLADKNMRNIYLTQGKLWGIAIDENRQLIASGGNDCKITIWKFDSAQSEWKPIHEIDHKIDKTNENTFISHKDQINSLAFHPEKPVLASASDDGKVKLWLYKIAFIADKQGNLKWIASAHQDGKIFIYDGNLKEQDILGNNYISDNNSGTGAIYSLAFSEDSLFAGSEIGKIVLWKLKEEKWKRTKEVEEKFNEIIVRHWDRIHSLAYNLNKELLASASQDGAIKVWDKNGNLLYNIADAGNSDQVFVGWTTDDQLVAINQEMIINLSQQDQISQNIFAEEQSHYPLEKIAGNFEISGFGAITVWEQIPNINLISLKNDVIEDKIVDGCKRARAILEDPFFRNDNNANGESKNFLEVRRFCRSKYNQ